MSRDELGDRMKANYENRSRYYLPRRTYTLIRVDGRSFHTFMRGMDLPFDDRMIRWMDWTAVYLCENITGARFAYVQSDEITVLLTDFDSPETEAWFDGSVNKIVSISASLATEAFNRLRVADALGRTSADLRAVVGSNWAQFDSRAFTIADPGEVENAFIWRQQDATRNAISMVANANFPSERLYGLSCDTMLDLLLNEKGVVFDDLPAGRRRGRFVERVTHILDLPYVDKRTGESHTATGVRRSVWEVTDAPLFAADRGFLRSRIPIVEPTKRVVAA